MNRISKKEKKELLRMANSAELRRDFRIMNQNKKQMTSKEYLMFLTSASEVFPYSGPNKHKKYKNTKI